MKNLIYLILALISISTTSCLKRNLEDLPEFEENDITSIQRVEYRFISNDVSNASGQKIVKFVNLSVGDIEKSTENKTISANVSVPAANSSFSEEERSKVSLENLVVIVNLSTAARISPIGNSPKLGTPGNWSKPNKYLVKAANGNTAEWTIEIKNLTK